MVSSLRDRLEYREKNLIEFFGRKGSTLQPNPKQDRLLKAWLNRQKKVFTYTGGNRTGKTTIAAIIFICMMAGKWLWNDEDIWFPHNNPRKLRVIGQDWEKHISTVVVPELKKWWPDNRPVKLKKNNIGVEAMWVDELTGSTLEIMSNKQDSDLFEGWQGDGCYYDEPPRRDVRVACARGLVDRLGRELFAMTLLKEAWVDREVIKAVNPDGTPDMSVFNVHAEIYDNIGYGITKEGVEQFEKTLTPEEKDARLRGIPSYMSGLVAKDFDREQHIIKRFDIPTDWMVDIHIDVHPRMEQAVLFVATDQKNDRYACFEIFENGDGKQTADRIVRIVNRYALRVNRVLCDPLAKGDQNNTNTTFDKISEVLARHGMALEVGSKDKQSGIIEINRHLKGPNNKPSLWFFSDLVRTIYEIEGWMYDKETQKPQKKDDHMMEGLYRILLLDTKWEDPDDEYDPDEEDNRYRHNTMVSPVTAY